MNDDPGFTHKQPKHDEVNLNSHILYKKLIENTSDAVFIVNLEGQHVEANTQWANFLARPREEILTLTVWDVMSESQVQECKKTMQKLLSDGSVPIYTRDFIRSDSAIVTGEMNAVLIDDNGDDSKFILVIVKDITKWQEETEKAVRSSETKYLQLLENIPQRVFYKDTDSVYMGCNPAFALDFGISAEEIVGKTDYDLYSKAMADLYVAFDKQVLASQAPYKQNEPYFVDGEELVTEIQKTPVRDEDGNITGILGIFWDITEPVKAKLDLEKSEKQYRLLYENLTDGVYKMDARGFITWASQKAADIFGKTREEVVGVHISEFIHPDEREQTMVVIKEALTTGDINIEGFEVKGIRKNGSVFYYQVNNKVLEENGEIVGIQGLVRDITEFRIAQDALETSEERYRTFAENFQGIAFRGTLDWIPQFFHGSVEAITGYKEADFTAGNPRWDQIIHPDDKEFVFKIGDSLSEVPNNVINRKYRIIKKNGEVRWLHEFTSNVCDEEGVPKWVQGSIYDITDVVLAEKTLKRSLNDLEIYASLLQHDLRNDLQVLLNQSEISLLSDDMNELETKYWKIVEGTSHSMIRLLDVFIKPRRFYELAITDLMEILVQDIKITYPDLHIEVQSDLPSSEFTVIGSRLLPCVFDNLFRNVVEHAGSESKVIINLRIEDNQAVIDFSDDGPGIEKAILSKLIQKGISTTGGGYGLYLSKKIIEAYEGTINVVDEDKKGTTFRIVLPSI